MLQTIGTRASSYLAEVPEGRHCRSSDGPFALPGTVPKANGELRQPLSPRDWASLLRSG